MNNPGDMKKYLTIFVFIVIALTSCNDMLNLRDNGKIEMNQVFSDRNRTRGYLNSCYSNIQGMSINSSSWTDDAVNAASINAGTFDVWYNRGVNSNNFATYNIDGNPWGHYYRGIRKCNVFLANIGNSTAFMTEKERIGWRAQALVLRAFYYLQIVKRYGSAPLITKPFDFNHDFSSDKKAPVSELVSQILADCDEAISVPDSYDFSYTYASNQWGIMTKAVAQAVRLEAVMYAISPLFDDGSFSKDNALAVASDALAKLIANDYSLWTTTSGSYSAYATYFLYNPNDLRATDKETILGGARVAVWSSSGVPITEGQSSAGNCPTQELVDSYEMDNGTIPISGYSDTEHLQPIINTASGYDPDKPYVGRDPRFYDCILFNGATLGSSVINTTSSGDCKIDNTNVRFTQTGYYMRKYRENDSNKNSNNDGYVRLIRMAEAYLNFAEVAYQVAGPYTVVPGVNLSAASAINIVRNRAGMPDLPASLSNSDFEARYRNERRIEFAFEHDRYFSLRRWKTLPQTDRVTGMDISETGGILTYSRFAFSKRPTCEEKYLLYPLDLTESNKIIEQTGTSWQNPGW